MEMERRGDQLPTPTRAGPSLPGAGTPLRVEAAQSRPPPPPRRVVSPPRTVLAPRRAGPLPRAAPAPPQMGAAFYNHRPAKR